MKGRILLVEDDEHIRDIYSLFIKGLGYSVTEAGSVKTALMHLDALDLVGVVLDLRLPNGHGRRVVEDLKSKRDDVPIVILSAFPNEIKCEFPVVAALKKAEPGAAAALRDALNKAMALSFPIFSLHDSVRRLSEITGVR